MMYPQQLAYREAKRKRDELYQLSGDMQNVMLDTWQGDLTNDADLERYAEEATSMEREIGLPQATAALQQAEDALIDWGIAYCKKHPSYNPIISTLAESKNVGMREHICMTMLRLGTFDTKEKVS